jgi:membrane protein DedA with SNARE-associated domain
MLSVSYLADYSYLIYYLSKIGPAFIFLALTFGIIGLPLPDELILLASGYLVAHDKLDPLLTLGCALTGSMAGITISYLIGYFISSWVIKKFGKRLNFDEIKLKKVESWFKRIGKWILILGYFIPLFRHLIGFVAGGTKLKYKDFAIYAYIGATIWSITFLLLGFYFHEFFRTIFNK